MLPTSCAAAPEPCALRGSAGSTGGVFDWPFLPSVPESTLAFRAGTAADKVRRYGNGERLRSGFQSACRFRSRGEAELAAARESATRHCPSSIHLRRAPYMSLPHVVRAALA